MNISFANVLIDVRHALLDIVESTLPYFSRLQAISEDITVAISLITTHIYNKDKIENRSLSLNLHIDKPFWPIVRGSAEHLDEIVWAHLSLQLRGTDASSQLLSDVSKAGGYLCLLFPASEAPGSLHVSGDVYDSDREIERRLKAHFTRFSVLRFAELVDRTMTAIRSIDTTSMPRDECLNAVAAAGVLYCELEYVNQGLRDRNVRVLCVGWLEIFHVSLYKPLMTLGSC